VYTRIAVGAITYVRGLQKGQSCASIQSFMRRSRSIQVDANNNTCNVSKSYKWFETYLWAEEISKDLLRFGFLIFLVIGRQGCP
jgi:hypothetical protein